MAYPAAGPAGLAAASGAAADTSPARAPGQTGEPTPLPAAAAAAVAPPPPGRTATAPRPGFAPGRAGSAPPRATSPATSDAPPRPAQAQPAGAAAPGGAASQDTAGDPAAVRGPDAAPDAAPDAGPAADPARPSSTAASDAALATPAPPAAAAASAPAAGRATVPGLAAEIVRQAGRKASRFDVTLDPDGLGRVDVRLQIAADGRLSARLSFDRPETAAALGARAGELRQALSQAGFDVAPQALSFETAAAGFGGGFSGFQDWRGAGGGADDARSGSRAFAAAQPDPDPPLAATSRSSQAASGLDIRI